MAVSKKQARGRASSERTARGPTKSANWSMTGKTETTGRSGRMGESGKSTSTVTGRFVFTTTEHKSAFGEAVTKRPTTAPKDAAGPAIGGHKPPTDPFLSDLESGIAVDVKALIAELAMPEVALGNLFEKRLLLEVFAGASKTETVTIGEDLATYLKALRVQLDQVVLPSVLARLVMGALPIAPERLAERMLAVAPAPAPANRMAEQVGPEYFDTNGVRTILAAPGAEPISKQAVEHRRNRHTVLALQTTDRRWIYPTWQFRDHDVLPGLAEVLAGFYPPQRGRDQTAASRDSELKSPGAIAMARSAPRVEPFSRWSVATWVTTPLRDLEGLSVADWLLEDRDHDRVVELARRTAAAWAV